MEITLKFNGEQLNVLAQALAELPFKVAAPLIQHIQGQVNAQTAPTTPPAAIEEAPASE